MSTRTPLREALDQVLALQKIDSERDRAARSRANLDTGASLQARLDEVKRDSDATRNQLGLAKRSLADSELELEGIESKRKSYEQRMRTGQVTNPREVANIEKEIGQLLRQRSTLDGTILGLMDEMESLKTALAHKEAQSNEAEQALTTHKQLYRANVERLEAEINRLGIERSGAAAAVTDQALLKRYETLRARPANSGIGAAKVDDMHCGGCHSQVSTFDTEHVRVGDRVVTCENCGRILG